MSYNIKVIRIGYCFIYLWVCIGDFDTSAIPYSLFLWVELRYWTKYIPCSYRGVGHGERLKILIWSEQNQYHVFS